MIRRDHALSLTRQAKALSISRGSVYYQPRPVSESDLALMKLIDRLHLDYPFMRIFPYREHPFFPSVNAYFSQL